MKELEREIDRAFSLFQAGGGREEVVKHILNVISERDGRILENTIKCIEKNRDKFNRSGALGNIDLITQIFDDLEKEGK